MLWNFYGYYGGCKNLLKINSKDSKRVGVEAGFAVVREFEFNFCVPLPLPPPLLLPLSKDQSQSLPLGRNFDDLCCAAAAAVVAGIFEFFKPIPSICSIPPLPFALRLALAVAGGGGGDDVFTVLAFGLGVRGKPISDKGGLSIAVGSTGDEHRFNAVDRNVRDASELLLLCVIPESGEVLQLIDDGTVSVSIERRVLSNSVEANATKRSKPELTRCCQCVSSSAIISSV
ncbi:hypothetical protein GQX74_000415 [Glossina fuscipes]|nr:hypothetical protein GQX74_000415 [Glossina fuscipes]